MAAYMLIFSGEIRRRSKKPKVFKLLTSNHKLLTAVWRLQLTLQTWTQNSLVTQWPNGYLCIGQEGRLASLLKVTGSRDKMICYAHGAVLTSSILPDCLTLSPFKSFPTAFQAHFPNKHHQTVDNIREICEEPLSLLLWYQNWQFNPHQLTMRLKKAAMLWLLSSRSQCFSFVTKIASCYTRKYAGICVLISQQIENLS